MNAPRVRRFAVGRGLPTAEDVIDYAILLIEVFGWNNYGETGQSSNETNGFTLHDSIGEACTRISAAVEPAETGRGGKDWVASDGSGAERRMRDEATQAVSTAIAESGFTPPQGVKDDYAFNDAAADANEVLDLLRAAKAVAAR
jgi:hypothetical protein